MKIAVITSGILPVPAVKGGAIENLIDYYLEYNEIHKLHDITIYSIYDKKANAISNNISNNHYQYIKINSFFSKFERKIFQYVHNNGFYNYFIEFFISKVIQKIKKTSFDLIIIENRPGYVLSLSEITNTPIVLHLHNDLLNNKIKHALEIYEKCSSIITVSEYLKKQVETIHISSKIKTIYNGIDIQSFQNSIPINKIELGFKKNDFIVVFSGRLIREKGIKELIEAFHLIKNPQIKLLIIGGNFFGNDLNENSFIKELRTIASPIKDKIVFTGFIPYSHIPSTLAACDLGVVPSIWEEPFGLTSIEHQAAGLPLIITKSGGLTETVDKKYTIIIEYNQNFTIELATNIERLYHDKKLRKQMSIHGLQKISLFRKEKYAQKFIQELSSK